MRDEHYETESSIFSLFSKKEIEQQKFIDEINLIVEKYNILENENQLVSSTDKTFLYLINYVISLNEKNESIPKDVECLFLENIFLKENINAFLEKNLENLTENESTNFFKEITLILSILSIGSNQKVLNVYYDYDYESISKLFRFYESLLKNLFETNYELFSLSFNSYTILLKTFIQLCRIKSIDIIKMKDINTLLDYITETINTLKFTILLKKEHLEKLTSIQGKYLFYFSHLDDIDIKLDHLDKGIEKYYLNFEKQVMGYMIYKENMIFDENFNSNEFLILKNYSSILILKLISRLKKILQEKDYFTKESFQKISRLYYKTFSNEFDHNRAQNINSFEKDLLNSFLYSYSNNFNFTEKINYHTILEDFIVSERNFNSANLETIYNILQFANDIQDFKYYYISEILADYKVIKNDYHEFYKLCIFNLTINKPLYQKYPSQKVEILNKIFEYIKDRDIEYQLIPIYSKLYLDLSLFYSNDKTHLEKAKELYFIFMQLTNDYIYKDNYLDLSNKIISNIKIFEPNLTQDDIIKKFLNTKNLESKNDIFNIEDNTNNDLKNIILEYIDDDEYEINY